MSKMSEERFKEIKHLSARVTFHMDYEAVENAFNELTDEVECSWKQRDEQAQDIKRLAEHVIDLNKEHLEQAQLIGKLRDAMGVKNDELLIHNRSLDCSIFSEGLETALHFGDELLEKESEGK